MQTTLAPNTPLLNVQNVSWEVDEHAILNNINLHIAKGKFIGLIGPNGAGKSSLLRCLYRFNKPTAGNVTFNQQDIWQLKSEDYAKYVLSLIHI